MTLATEQVVPATSEAVALFVELLNTIEAKSPKLAEAIRLAAIPMHFDRELLKALRATDDQLEDKIIERLNQFSFLGEREGQYFITSEVRHYLLTEQQKQPEWFTAAHSRALAYFENQLAHSASLTPAQREALQQAQLYHLLAVDPQRGVERLEELVRQARDEYRPAAAERFLAIAEEQRSLLPPAQALYVNYLQGVIAQLTGRLQISHDQLANLLIEYKDQLTPDLRARVQRELGRTLAELSREVEAITFNQQALDGFTQQNNQIERALTLVNLGRTYLQLALEVWGGGEPFLVKPPRWRWLWALFSFITRLPLVIYLITQFGLRSLLPVLHRIGRNMDWLVARLFVAAVHRFEQAERIFSEAGDRAGVIQVQEDLGRLYLSFNHPRASEQIWRTLLEKFGYQLDPYRTAVAQLGLGWVLLRQNQLGEAHRWLEQVLPIFTYYGHERRIAQTQTLLAQLAVREQQPARALPHYLAALKLWRKLNNLQEATDVAHQLDALHTLTNLPMSDRQTAQAASAFTVDRLYLNRFHHRALDLFMRAALVALVIVCLFTLSAAVRSEAGTSVDANAALIKPITASAEDETAPTVVLTTSEQLAPDFNISVVASTLITGLFSYLLLYSLAGLYFIFSTPLETIAETQQTNLRVFAQGLQLESEQGHHPLFKWEEIEAVVLADRFRIGNFTSVFSRTSFVAQDQHLSIDGYTNHYVDLQRYVLRRLSPQVRVYNLGFRLPASLSGLAFCVAVTLLSVYVVLAKFEVTKGWLTTPVFGNYSLSAFYNLCYLGIALPLIWWFLIQPVRRRLIFTPASPFVWLVGGMGLGFALIAFTRFIGLTQLLQIGRPDIAPAVLAIFLLIAAALHIVRARYQGLHQIIKHARPTADNPFVYPPRLRLMVVLVTAILLILLVWQIGRELLSLHYLVQANTYLQKGENAATQGQETQANRAYNTALENYDRSLTLGQYSPVYNSRGVILDQLGREQEAAAAYEQAIQRDPFEPAYRINLALTYINQVSDTVPVTQNITLYQQAIGIYDELLETPSQTKMPSPYPVASISDQRQLDQARFFRAGTYYALARLLNVQKPPQTETALEYGRRSFDDYRQLIIDKHQTDEKRRAAYYAGRGWAQVLLRIRYATTEAAYKQSFQDAIDDFSQAARLDNDNVSAQTGLGWAYWWLLRSVDGCTAANQQGVDRNIYIQTRQNSISALTEAIRLQRTSAIHYRTRAQLYYLLRDCPKKPNVAAYNNAVQSYDSALTFAPDNLGWHELRGRIYLELASVLTNTIAQQTAYQGARDSFIEAVKRAPNDANYIDWLLITYRRLGLSDRQAVDQALIASGRPPGTFDSYFWLGQQGYKRGDYRSANITLKQALALQPEHYETNLLLGRTLSALKEYTGAVTLLQHSLGLTTDKFDVYMLLAQANAGVQHYTEVITVTTQALQLKPNEYGPYLLRAQVYQKLGEKVLASKAAEKALQLATQVAQFNELAQFYRTIGDDQQALLAAHRGNELDLAYPDSLGLLGWNAYTKDRNFSLAVRATMASIDFQPTEPRLYFNLGVIQLAAGNLDAAHAAYADAIRVAALPQNAGLWHTRYNEAINDVAGIIQDPKAAKSEFITLLINARDARTLGFSQ